MSKHSTPVEFFKKYAISRGGVCLTDKYENQKTRLTFRCAKNHEWTTGGGSLKSRNSWCPYCANPSLANSPELKQERLAALQQLAESKGGKLLSTEYVNSKNKLSFMCSEGHTWNTVAHSVEIGCWCKKCATKIVSETQRDNLQTFIDIAIEKGGKCLSTEYINASNQLLFECAEGHQWMGRPGGIKRGTWCRKCYGTAKSDIEEMKSIAAERGGSCLSSEYVTDAVKLAWQCCEGHIWEASPNNIKHDKWCPTCSEGLGERICRLFFQRFFGFDFVKVRPTWLRNSKGFLLELDGYCEELGIAFEHQGRQHYSDVSFFSKRIRYDEEKRNLCQLRGIKLIEIPEVLNDIKIKDLKPFIIKECEKNSIELPDNIRQLEITPLEIFTYTKNQERRLLAQKAEAKIISKGGTLLGTHLTDKGISFEILCANKHRWSITNSNLSRDRWCPMCRQEISSNLRLAKKETARQKADARQELLAEKQRLHSASKQKAETRKLLAVVKNSHPKADRKQLSIQKMLAVANAYGGECLSEKYVNDTTPLLWTCDNEHQWSATPNRIKNGGWCPECASNKKGSFAQITQLVLSRGGKCHSDSYVNNYTKVELECEHKHRFTTTVKSLKRGSWCPQCAIEERARKKRLSIDDMHLLASRKHGKCLSTLYTNSTTKLLWECENGHQFYSKPGNVQTGYWCPKCAVDNIVDKAAKQRKIIVEQILKDKQGEIISIDTNFGRKDEAIWRCKKGHEWKTRIENILDGHWCPRCSNSENWNDKKTSIREVRQFAQSKGGDCLSPSYDTAKTKLTFICKEGHTWSALWHNVKSKGCWCPKCASKHRWDIRKKESQSFVNAGAVPE